MDWEGADGASFGFGLGIGRGAGLGAGFGTGLGAGLGTGFGVGLGTGFGVGLGTGLGVGGTTGLGAGFGLDFKGGPIAINFLAMPLQPSLPHDLFIFKFPFKKQVRPGQAESLVRQSSELADNNK